MRLVVGLVLAVSAFAVYGAGNTAPPSALKAAFAQARELQTIDVVLPILRKAELYAIVRPDPEDPTRQVFYLVPSPKGRPAVTVSESLSTLERVTWPKRRITGEQLLAELQAGQEIVIAYPDGGDHVTLEQLEWFKSLP